MYFWPIMVIQRNKHSYNIVKKLMVVVQIKWVNKKCFLIYGYKLHLQTNLRLEQNILLQIRKSFVYILLFFESKDRNGHCVQLTRANNLKAGIALLRRLSSWFILSHLNLILFYNFMQYITFTCCWNEVAFHNILVL